MKVLGEYLGGDHNCWIVECGGYALLEIQWVVVVFCDRPPYGGAWLKVRSEDLELEIRPKDGSFLSVEVANKTIKTIAAASLVNLDEYGLGLFNGMNIHPDNIAVINETDEDYNNIPLEVRVVE